MKAMMKDRDRMRRAWRRYRVDNNTNALKD